MSKSKTKSTKKEPAADAKPKLNEKERELLAQHIERLNKATPSPKIKITTDDQSTFVARIDHPSEAGFGLLMEALGVDDYSFGKALIDQLIQASVREDGQVNQDEVNFMLSVVTGTKPKDKIEAMLAMQMAAVHTASMRFSNRMRNAETLPAHESFERGFNRLTRTFTAQMDALKRYRSSEQQVTVQNVSVTDNAQAIVTNVAQGTNSAAPANSSAGTLALADASGTQMPTIDDQPKQPVALGQPRNERKAA